MLNILNNKCSVIQKKSFPIYQILLKEQVQTTFLKKINSIISGADILSHASFYCAPKKRTNINTQISTWTVLIIDNDTDASLHFANTDNLVILEKNNMILYPSYIKSYISTYKLPLQATLMHIVETLPNITNELSK